jgi:hypothetical protein
LQLGGTSTITKVYGSSVFQGFLKKRTLEANWVFIKVFSFQGLNITWPKQDLPLNGEGSYNNSQDTTLVNAEASMFRFMPLSLT